MFSLSERGPGVRTSARSRLTFWVVGSVVTRPFPRDKSAKELRGDPTVE